MIWLRFIKQTFLDVTKALECRRRMPLFTGPSATTMLSQVVVHKTQNLAVLVAAHYANKSSDIGASHEMWLLGSWDAVDPDA